MIQILGKSTVSVAQCEQFLHNINPIAPYIAQIYKKYCDIYGIKLECAFVQMCLETNYLRYSSTSITTLDMHNYAGLGAVDGNGRRQALSFDTEEAGIQCHIQHLYAYCSNNSLPQGEVLIDPRFKYVERGCAPNIENLGNGHWASDKEYADKLVGLLNKLYQYNNIKINNKGVGNMIITYDFGHMKGSQDGGAVGYLNEYDVVRQYGQVCVNELKNAGYTMINCTPEDGSCSTVMKSLSYRARKSNENGANLHLCFHANCYDDESAHGAEIEYGSHKGAEFAQSVLNEICKLGFTSRDIKNPSLYMTGANVRAVSILIEPFFVSNKNDCMNYNANSLGQAIAKGVLNILGGGSITGNSNVDANRLLKLSSPMMYGADVVEVQNKLKKLGFNINADGYFGANTRDNVIAFQRNQNISADGIVGQTTLDRLNSAIKNLQNPIVQQPQCPPIDHSIPSNKYITWSAPNGLGYIETVPEKGRINIHLDKYNYLVIQDDPVEGNHVWIQTRSQGGKKII